MLHSANSRHDDDDPCRSHAVAGATPVGGDHGLFAAGLASSWSFVDDVPLMERSVAATYGCYDLPPPTPTVFQSPPSLVPPGMYHATELQCYPPSRRSYVEATPPYFVGDRRLPPEVVERAPSGVYGGLSMQYRDAKLAVTGSGGSLCSAPDDRDCSIRSALLVGDTRMRTPVNLTPPPSVFSWHGTQTSCLSSATDHDPARGFPSYYSNIVVDQPSCRSPVGADPAVEVCEGLHQATTGASTVRPLPRETRRRAAADREGMTTLARRPRTNFTSEQLRRLRQCFADCQYIDVEQRSKIAAALGLTEKQVKVWFQNQRSKMKRLQRTSDDMTSHHSTDDCLLIDHHHQQQQPRVSMTTVAKQGNNASLAAHLDALTSSPSDVHAIPWCSK